MLSAALAFYYHLDHIVKMRRFTLISIIPFIFLNACVSTADLKTQTADNMAQPAPSMSILGIEVFGEPLNIEPVSHVFNLTQAQRESFLLQFNAVENQSLVANKRIYQYLEGLLSNFNYYEDTLIASDALALNRGNCLSLAILTKTLADIVDVKSQFQLVETEPVYQKEGNIILSSQHVRTILFEPLPKKTDQFIIFPGRIVIDYFPKTSSRVLRSVDTAEFEAMYYRNIASEKFIGNDNNAAYWYIKKALQLKPADPHAVNMMALLHERAGYPQYAEKLFLFGLASTKEQLTLLNNYHSLLLRQKRYQEASIISKKLSQYDDPNPFKWISVANSAYNEANYGKAITYYRKASKLAPYLHETFAGMARAQYQLGHLNNAQKSLSKALKNVHKPDIRAVYQAKYQMLSRLLNKHDSVVTFSDTETISN